MQINRFFFPIYIIDNNDTIIQFAGTAFPITRNGGMLTCRHVVNIDISKQRYLAILDDEQKKLVKLKRKDVHLSTPDVDLAFLHNALQRDKEEFFPILPPDILIIGKDIYSFGFFSIGLGSSSVERGYFAGKIVNITGHDSKSDKMRITLPFSILEGMSGSPILTYHNGPKVVGVAMGNRQTRILASEILELEASNYREVERVYRIVELGVACHCQSIIEFFNELRIDGILVSDKNEQIANLK